MNLHSILLMAPTGSANNPLGSAAIMVAMVAVMYFFLIRPQMKKAKEQKEFSNSSAIGDMIVTTAGIHGKIVKMNDDNTMSVEVDRNTVLKLDKSAISLEMTTALRKKMAGTTKA